MKAFNAARAALVGIVVFASMNGFNARAEEKVIYGQDNRKDLYEVTNPAYTKLAASTVVLVKKASIQQSSGMVKINAKSFAALMGVCKTERFADQPSGGFCSGSLIGKNLMLTAGHCITDSEECADTRFVFGYAVNKKGHYPSSVPSTDVYACKTILHREQDGTGADFAIIELDRAVTNHEPAKLAMGRVKNEITKDTKLLMIGHPAGLPTKVEDGGKVRDASKTGFFVANTDSYGGNSGSAVFNRDTGEIEGVLVRGETDYVSSSAGCYVSNVCKEDDCRGEDVTKISSVIAQLPKQ